MNQNITSKLRDTAGWKYTKEKLKKIPGKNAPIQLRDKKNGAVILCQRKGGDITNFMNSGGIL